MNVDKLDTHYYDGKLQDVINIYKDEIENINDNLYIEKILSSVKYLNDICIQKGCSQRAKYSLSKIMNDRNGNHDNKNGLDAELLMYMIYTRIINLNDDELIELLNIQLDEMVNGLCPQGRCIRLLQILKAIDSK